MKSFEFYKQIFTLALLFCGSAMFAQPANDNCSGAIEIPLAASAADCVPTQGTTLGTNPDDQASNPPLVCSGSWFRDDVYYTFTTGDVVPFGGVRIEVDFNNAIGGAGIATYLDGCQLTTDNYYFVCSNYDDGISTLPAIALSPNTQYLIRVWSIGSPTANSADFAICTYGLEGEAPGEVEVLWGDNGEGSFTGGLNGWTVENTVDTCGWEAWPNGFDDRDISCLLNSPTSSTGTVAFNSAYYDRGGGGCAAPHSGALVSPLIDLTGNEQEYLALEFWQTFFNFSSQTFVEYSFDDGATWQGRQINTDVNTNTTSTVSNFKFNLPFEATQGQSSIRFRFRFEATYYWWMIDDVRLLVGDCVDLVAPANAFYSIAPNYATPVSQVQEIAFLNDVANVGACDLDNVVLTATISDDSGVIYTDTKDYGTILASTDVQNEPFDDVYMMPGAVGTYTGNYSVTNGQEDGTPRNNTESFEFVITDDLFTKERGGLVNVFNLNPALWDEDENKSWGVGNHFYVPNGAGWAADSLDIGFSGDANNAGSTYDVFLFKWVDNGDGLVQLNEREIVGSNSITVAGDEGFNLPRVKLFAEDGSDHVMLEDNTHYIAWVQFSDGDAIIEFNLLFDNEFSYNAMDLAFDSIAARAMDPNLNRHSTFWITDSDLDGEYRIFGRPALIRMPIECVVPECMVSTDDPLPIDNKISVYPNPANDQLSLKLDLAQNEDYARVNIIDITGKMMNTYELENVQVHTATYDVSNLPSGAYLMQYISETGTRTMKFTKF